MSLTIMKLNFYQMVCFLKLGVQKSMSCTSVNERKVMCYMIDGVVTFLTSKHFEIVTKVKKSL